MYETNQYPRSSLEEMDAVSCGPESKRSIQTVVSNQSKARLCDGMGLYQRSSVMAAY